MSRMSDGATRSRRRTSRTRPDNKRDRRKTQHPGCHYCRRSSLRVYEGRWREQGRDVDEYRQWASDATSRRGTAYTPLIKGRSSLDFQVTDEDFGTNSLGFTYRRRSCRRKIHHHRRSRCRCRCRRRCRRGHPSSSQGGDEAFRKRCRLRQWRR